MSRLFLVRHGQSIWNLQNRFTGWVDVSLSPEGTREAERVGRILADERFDAAYTSTLIRAQDTLYEILKHNRRCQQYRRVHEIEGSWYDHFSHAEQDRDLMPVYISEALNERAYGDLQGLDKDAVREQYGEEQFLLWRRSYDTPPPGGESLEMTARRVIPYYRSRIEPELARGHTVLVSAHGNSLRALAMYLEGMTAEEIVHYEIPTGVPYIYTIDEGLHVVDKEIRQVAA